MGALRKKGLAEITIKNYMAHLRASLRWALRLNLLRAVPAFPTFPGVKSGEKEMKGRPVTEEEFGRMMDATPGVVGEAAAPSWQFLLEGFWLSGLRLREAVALSWERDAGISVDLSGKLPLLKIKGTHQKSRRDQLYPVVPEFGEFLLTQHENARHGRVFKVLGAVNQAGGRRTSGLVRDPYWIGRIVSRIGEAAGVVVEEEGRKKYASAHDLRRSFGSRWAERVMPAVLQKLMRHAHISTTMRFYVRLEAQEMAAKLWRDHSGNTPGNTGSTNGGKPVFPPDATHWY